MWVMSICRADGLGAVHILKKLDHAAPAGDDVPADLAVPRDPEAVVLEDVRPRAGTCPLFD